MAKKNEEETKDEAAEAAEPTPEAEDAAEAPEEPAAEAEVASEDEPAVELAAEAQPEEEAPAAEEAAPEEEPATEAAAGAEPTAEPEAQEEPGVEEPAAAEAEPATEPAAEAEPAGPGPKKKRLPRPLRPQRSKKPRVKPAARKPIVRLEKPEHERGRRQERQGTVVSSAMDKTIVVKVDVLKAHPKYKKVVRRSTTFHAHDEQNEANVGDVVRIVETRPLSKTKRWRLAEIVEAAK